MNLLPLSDRSLNFLALAEANKKNANSCDLAILEGHYDMQVLSTSIDKIASLHPIMQSRIVRKGLKYYWKYDEMLYPEKLELDWSDCFQDAEQWHAALRQYVIDNPVDPYSGSPVKFVYIRFRQRSALLFISSHTASDARSGYILFEQLNSLLLNQPLPRKDNSFCEEHMLFDRVKVKALLKASAKLAVDLCKSKKAIAVKGSEQWRVDYHDFGLEATEALKNWSNQHQVSVNVALNYILNKALNDGHKYTVLETMSLRGLAKKDLAASYNNLIMPFGSEIGGESYWIKAYQARLQELKLGGYKVHQAEQRIQSYSINLVPKCALKLLVEGYKRLFLNGNVILSNLGKLEFDLNYIGSLKILDVYNFSVPLPPAGLALVASTYNGRLRISFAYRNKAEPLFVQAIERELADLNN
ncbi:hypothetical protein [Pseudoalteromonas luteoviolacea]|uniref:Condensation domain-containing protein n=1 Tax=Pseudoalteromonas luteoviolacea S4054 TaxID=1129367 RepID=A0A0F6ADK9_9GAMM|nr:hypothetical protein [Pseudoalteromonas luteoviolacea]AOT08534.1 hypothetical protein S4054249_12045 [Pseudoalteromonas luteoviolacea]AOT13450.1 hypothetical protein S40542_12020 [Pseudoalteromonas luteoviolacea]AOT18363.1 hypothetical protein S4054_12020 [Pseudoalteromonas luteoviolacea]KKE83469.1 hypothetical protein N479_13945 [Pseudoalteromonas luteoviolacea S4054]KZN75906.1 hypothetical protein N481_06040 [Pseudoalteromonas luteoviolacea S4047-1]